MQDCRVHPHAPLIQTHDPTNKEKAIRHKSGAEFNNAVQKRHFLVWCQPMWGKGLNEIKQ